MATFVVVLFATMAVYMTPARFVGVIGSLAPDAILAIVWILCAMSCGAAWLSLVGVRVTGSLECVTAIAVGLGTIALLTLALGLAGFLNTLTAVAILLACLILQPRRKWAAFSRLRHWQAVPWIRQPAGWQWLWIMLAPMLAITLTGASLAPGFLWKNQGDPHPYDVMEYHLQLPREWFELGRIIPLHHNVFSFFPLNAEMQSLLAMHLRRGPWAGMFLAQFVQTACMIAAVVAVYGGIRRLRPGDSARYAILAAVAMGVTPWIVMLGSVGYDESALLLYASTAIAWALAALAPSADALSNHRGRAKFFAIAGALTGLACGVKYTAAPFLLVGIPLAWGAASVGNRLDLGRLLRHGVIFIVLGLTGFSPWLVKNIVWAKNPVFPLAMRVLGRAHFSETQVVRFERAHSPLPAQRSLKGRLGATWSELLIDWRYTLALWPLAFVAMFISRLRWEARFLAVLLLIIFVVWIGFTHLLSRFFVIAVPVAALLIGTLPCAKSWSVALGMVILMLGGGWFGLPGVGGSGLHAAIAEASEKFGQLGGFALDDPRWLVPQEMLLRTASNRIENVEFAPILSDPSDEVALIGNAMPFIYPTPMSRLRYRTVFDVDSAAGFPNAWLPLTERAVNSRRFLVIHPDEIQRLSSTYYDIPNLPSNWSLELSRPVLEQR